MSGITLCNIYISQKAGLLMSKLSPLHLDVRLIITQIILTQTSEDLIFTPKTTEDITYQCYNCLPSTLTDTHIASDCC